MHYPIYKYTTNNLNHGLHTTSKEKNENKAHVGPWKWIVSL